MRKIAFAGLVAVLLCGATLLQAAEMPKMPPPTPQHKWLNKFVGRWSSQVTIYIPGQKKPMKASGTERYHTLGAYWLVGDIGGKMMGMDLAALLTVGYDSAQKKYIGTWVDNGSGYMWKYIGSVDATGKKITLMTQGPCPMKGGQMVQFKEITEFKSANHKVYTSAMLDDGKWVTLMTIDSRRTRSR